MISARSFRAMGSEFDLFVIGANAAAALEAAEAEVHRLEALLSRFRDDSQLSRLNRDGSVDAAPELVQITELALTARAETGGRFDPTVHDAVAAAGYDRTFAEVRDSSEPPASAPCGGEVRLRGKRIELATGVRLDFGGIGKGYAADRVAAMLAETGPCLVNAGGDIAAHGASWPVGVATGDGDLTLSLDHGGLATSGRDRRRWRRAGTDVHHLIDPAVGVPARSDLVRVTVAAASAVAAEVWAKALFLAGVRRAAEEADERALPCVLVTSSGGTQLAGGLS